MPVTPPHRLVSLARSACGSAAPQWSHDFAADSPSGWVTLFTCASIEGMDGLLYNWMIGEGEGAAIPQDIRRSARRRHASRLLDYQVKHQALEELLHDAGGEGIRVMILQGMAIADVLYPPGVRPLSDIDLLVRPDEFERTERVLCARGYRMVSRYPPVYVRDGICIDLHRQLASLSRVEPTVNPLRIDETMLWSNAVSRAYGAAMAWVLSPIDQIALLSAHLQKHSFNRLIWFVDIGLLLNRLLAGTPFDAVRERAAQLSLEQPLYFVCTYLQRVLALPSLHSASMNAPPLTWAENRLAAWLMRDHRIDGMGDLLYLLSIRPRTLRRRFLRRIVFPNADMMREQAGSSSATRIAWAYLARCGRLTWQGVRLAGRLLQRRLQTDR